MPIDKLYNFLNHGIIRHLEIVRRRIISIYQALDCLRLEGLSSFGCIYEVKEKTLVKVGVHLFLIIKIELIVEFGKFENYLHGFRLVVS